MAQRSTKVYSADYTELKKQLDAELNRRGKSEGTGRGQSVGSMAAYISSFSVVPAAGRQITNEHIQKITQPISAITGSAITPENGSKVAADVLTRAAALLSQLSAISETATSSGCGGACSGLCTTGCYSACSSCTGSCTGGCTGSCTKSCANDCTGSCTGSCVSTCTGTCTGSCTKSCANDCTSTCTGTCTGSCTGTCTGTCTKTCANDCGGSCAGGCTGTCAGTCVGTCTGSCTGSCTKTCADNCTNISIGEEKSKKVRFGSVYDGLYTTDSQRKAKAELDAITLTSQSEQKCIDCPVSAGCGWCSGLNYEMYGTANKRFTGICWAHKARVLASAYYHNRRYIEIGDCLPIKAELPKDDALEILPAADYEEFLKIERAALLKFADENGIG